MRRASWLLVLQSLIGLALLGAWLMVVDVRELIDNLATIELSFLALAGGLGLLSILIRSVRWKLVLAPVAKLPLLDLLSIGLASSLINFIIPIRSGELARGVFLKQRHHVSLSTSLPTVALDRSLDLLAVLLIGVIGAVGGIARGRSISLIIVLGVALFLVFGAFVAATVLVRERLADLIQRLVPRSLSAQFRDRVIGVLLGLLAGFASIGQQPRRLVPLLALSLTAALVDSAVFVVLFEDLGAGVSPLSILVGYALFALTFIIPGAPGYVGSMEAFGSLVFIALGIPTALAASGIVIFHGINAAMLAAGGGIGFWALGVRPGQVLRSAMGPAQEPGAEVRETL